MGGGGGDVKERGCGGQSLAYDKWMQLRGTLMEDYRTWVIDGRHRLGGLNGPIMCCAFLTLQFFLPSQQQEPWPFFSLFLRLPLYFVIAHMKISKILHICLAWVYSTLRNGFNCAPELMYH